MAHTRWTVLLLLAACASEPAPEEAGSTGLPLDDLARHCEELGEFGEDRCGQGLCADGPEAIWREALLQKLGESWGLAPTELEGVVRVRNVEETSDDSWRVTWTEQRDWVVRQVHTTASGATPPTVAEAVALLGEPTGPLPADTPRPMAEVADAVTSCAESQGADFSEAYGWCTVYTNQGSPLFELLDVVDEREDSYDEAVARIGPWDDAQDDCSIQTWNGPTY